MEKEESIFLNYKNSQIHCLRFGEGKDLLIAFHGYAYDGSIFLPLQKALGKRYVIYAIDLPYHGKTKWSKRSFQCKEVLTWIDLILEREQQRTCALLGYSYGGRVVQVLAQRMNPIPNHIYLLAPDGIFTRGLVNAHLVPKFIRRLLRKVVNNPAWIIKLTPVFYRLGLLSNYNLRFISYHLQSKERRDRLFNTWVTMTDFILYPKRTKAFFKQTKIPVNLYFGKRDEAIPLRSGKWMAKDLDNVHLDILDQGHRLIGSELIALMEVN